MTFVARTTASNPRVAVSQRPPLVLLAVLVALGLTLSLGAAQAQTRTAPPEVAAPPPGCPIGWTPVPLGLNPALRCLPNNLTVSLAPGRTAPPEGCPAGWQPVPPEVNPVLKCQPKNLGITTRPGAAPPSGCPTGWKPAPPGVNPVLRCLPDNLVLRQRPGSAAPPPGCPQGWKPVPPSVNPLLGCLPGSVTAPVDPLAARDQGGPIQADLALVDGFRLADQEIAWGTEATVQAAAASFKKMGQCEFRYLYRTRNEGKAASGATVNRILRDAPDGEVLATKALPALKPGQIGTSDGHLSLAPGTWLLYVHADAPESVAERNERNNLRRVRVTVEGSCG